MRTYANTSEPIYDLPMTTNINKPVYVNISRPTRDKPACRERLLENICSVSNFCIFVSLHGGDGGCLLQ